jgi:AcrR family transcriptional regulator
MPRHPDPDLEDRILNAAHVLWKRGGEQSLTMRAVADAAGTNTPAVYRRFKNRLDIVRALLRRIQDNLRVEIENRQSVEEIGEAYLDFALRHPHEYELFFAHAHDLYPRKSSGGVRPIRESRPNMALLERRLVERLGGSPEDHTRLGVALWAAAHGAALLLLQKAVPEGHEAEVRLAFSATVVALMDAASKGRSKRISRKTNDGR